MNSSRIDNVLSRKSSIFNHTTGEYLEVNDEIRLKAKNREEFFLVFVNNLKFLIDVPKQSLKVLIKILTSYVSWNNEVILNSNSRKELAEYCDTNVQVIYKSLEKLVKSNVLLKQDNGKLFLNPHIFGRGSWNDIKQLRQQLTFDYDFDNLESTSKVELVTLDKDMPPLENINILENKHYKDERGVEYNEVIIEEKEDNKKIVDAVIDDSLSISSNISLEVKKLELEILKEKNRELELKNKNLELENEKTRLQQQSLF